MASTDSLLDAHEVAVRARVEELREQAARVATELGEAELALEHVAITRATLVVVLAGGRPDGDAGGRQAGSERAAVPLWSVGLDERALPVGYRELWALLVKARTGCGARRRRWRWGWSRCRRRSRGCGRDCGAWCTADGRSSRRPDCSRSSRERRRSAGSRAAVQRWGARRARRRVIT